MTSDYTQSGLTVGTDPDYTISIPALMGSATFTLEAVDDMVDDDAETITFTVQDGTGYRLPRSIDGSDTVTVTITDDDDPPTMASVYIGSAGTQTGTIAEASTTSAMVTVALSAAAPSGGVTVSLMRSGSATLTSDFTVADLGGSHPNYTVAVAVGETTATFTVTAVNDSDDDDGEAAIFTVQAGTGYVVAGGGAATVTVAITDNDGVVVPTASVYIESAGTQAAAATEASGSGRSATVTVALDQAAPSGGVTVNLMRGGTATLTDDYTQSGLTVTTDPAYTLAIAVGETMATFTVTVVDDMIDDDAETVIFTVQSGTGYNPGSGGSKTVTVAITDDDTLGITASRTGQISLNAEFGDTTRTYTLVLDSQPTATVVVTLATSDATWVVSPARLEFTPANWNMPQTVTVTVTPGDPVSYDQERISYTVSGGDYDGYMLRSITVFIPTPA